MYLASIFSLVAVFLESVSGQLGMEGANSLDTVSTKPACQGSNPDCAILPPCIFAACTNFPNAECRNCYASCTPEFWNNGVEVTNQCSGTNTGTSSPSTGTNTGANTGANTNTGSPSASGSGGADSFSDLFTTVFNDLFNTAPSPSPSPSTGTGTGLTLQCPSGQVKVQCAAAPCSVSSCPAFPQANCSNNYCGSCKAVFTMNGADVTSQCSSSSSSGTGTQPSLDGSGQQQDGCTQQQVPCYYNPCQTGCPRYGMSANCVTSNCGGCFAKWYYQGTEVTNQCRVQQQQRFFNPFSFFLFPGFFDFGF